MCAFERLTIRCASSEGDDGCARRHRPVVPNLSERCVTADAHAAVNYGELWVCAPHFDTFGSQNVEKPFRVREEFCSLPLPDVGPNPRPRSFPHKPCGTGVQRHGVTAE